MTDTLFHVPPVLTPDDLPQGVVRPDFDEAKHRYSKTGKHMPGVTTILGVLDKPALPWWGMTIGVAGVIELLHRGFIDPLDPAEAWEEASIVRLLTKHKLTVNHVKDAAAARGSVAHDAAENWVKHGSAPNLSERPEEARLYVRSVAGYFVEMEPETVATEVMVWSDKHWYAGTFDALVRLDGRLGLVDYKTSKRAYDTHLLQLAAYECARRELKLDPVDFMGVVHISGAGEFDPDRHFFSIEGGEIEQSIKDWLAIKKAYDCMEGRRQRLKPLHNKMNPPRKRSR